MQVLAMPFPIVIGATGMEAVAQNIRMIVLTMAGSLPLDRSFAHDPAYIDAPVPFATARLIARLTDAIEKYEPRVKVESIRLQAVDSGMDGHVVPCIDFSLKDGVVL